MPGASDGPPDQAPDQASNSADTSAGLVQRYRTMPLPLQILIPVVILAVVVGAVWALSGSGDDSAGSDTTVAVRTELDGVLKGIIVVGGLTGSTETTAAAATPSTPAPGTTLDVATSPAPEPTETPATSAAPATTAIPATTAAPATTTASPATVPATTSAPETSAPPPTTGSPSSGLPTTADFFTQWNSATAGTNVPTISASQATELTGDYEGYYVITLSPAAGNRLPPQVGLVGTLTSPGSGQLAELLLVWIPGADEESSDFYWEAFGVLVQAISPGTTADETAALETTLGRAPGMPPFTAPADASSNGFEYSLFTQPYESTDGRVEVSAISAT